MKRLLPVLILASSITCAFAQIKHSASSAYPTYAGRVMCGYQGWFRAPTDGARQGWGHYSARGKFDPSAVHLDFWPDVSEYEVLWLTGQAGRMLRDEIPFSGKLPAREPLVAPTTPAK